MDSAGIPWYSTGTVNVTQGSSNVAGVGTNWVNAGLKVGDIFTIDKSRLYQITAINSNTSLSLQEAYQGATGTAQVYFVIRNFAGTMQAQIAAQVSELVNKYESYIDTELKQITGPAGPTSFPYRGTWATGRTYNGLDVVQYGNQLYMALYGHTSASANAPGATGTAWTPLSITASGDIITTTFGTSAGYHNSIYRGANLGSSVSAAQWKAIGNGTFDGLWIGDYWGINGTFWHIADFDYFLNTGRDTSGYSGIVTKHHIVIIPSTTLYNAAMNESNTNSGGYNSSLMRTQNLGAAVTQINSAFGENHILNYTDILSSVIQNGVVTSSVWANCKVELLSEILLYGHNVYEKNSTYGVVTENQLSLFRLNRHFLGRKRFWLRDVVSDTRFSLRTASGNVYYGDASLEDGVYPFFSICE